MAVAHGSSAQAIEDRGKIAISKHPPVCHAHWRHVAR